MILTRFGSIVTHIGWIDEEYGEASVVIQGENGTTRVRVINLSDLRADGGIAEILAATPNRRTN